MLRASIIALLMFATPASSTQGSEAREPAAIDSGTPDERALDAATRDLCDKEIALLGEATHGDGRTVEFKVKLVQRLVNECDFDALFFESSHYDFLEFSRRARAGEAVSPDMVSSS